MSYLNQQGGSDITESARRTGAPGGSVVTDRQNGPSWTPRFRGSVLLSPKLNKYINMYNGLHDFNG